ncbi:MAG: hypothetical protein QW291_01020 [Thermofilaceae archaeon]
MLAVGSAVKRARKGVIKTRLTIDTGGLRIVEAYITGDFFLYPEDALWKLEELLKGAAVAEVADRVKDALKDARLVGSTVEDFIEVIMKAVEGAGVR